MPIMRKKDLIAGVSHRIRIIGEIDIYFALKVDEINASKVASFIAIGDLRINKYIMHKLNLIS